MVLFTSSRALARLLMSSLAVQCGAISLTVSQTRGNETSSTMWGIMFEDINYSGDGGIHGQLIRNNGFQGDNPGLAAYSAISGTTLELDSSVPLSDALPNTLKVTVEAGATGQAGFANEGYWGIPVDGSLHSHNIFIRGNYQGQMNWILQSVSTKEVFANVTFYVDSTTDKFTEFHQREPTTFSSLTDIEYRMTFDAGLVAGSSLWFALPQLYPTTFHNRYNGLKPSLAEAVNNIGGSFLRFPGGNNLEGPNVENRWKWNETIGAITSRPGHQGAWGYPNTDALGLHEYFEWCDDMRLEPFLDVYSGYSLDGTHITGEALKPFVDEVLQELEYVLGDSSTPTGALRAKNGREQPWPVKWVEIGNEDDFGCSSYPERFAAFYNAIRPKYPDLQLIASATGFNCLPDPFPEDAWIDYHEYNIPENYIVNFAQWDNVSRRNKYIIAEMGRWSVQYSDMRGSVSEAVFMLGLERNSDLIRGVAFAPLLSLVNHQQWAPNLIPFKQAPDAIVYTSSYWVQQLFAHNAGDVTHEITSDSGFDPVFWSAVSAGETYIVKLANYAAEPQQMDIKIAGKGIATLSILANDDPDSANSHAGSPIAPPVISRIESSGDNFSFVMPAWSVAVLRAD
ncbi:putative alpha-L-arabinofuranosidase A [Colletotrichum siamense]|uniref:putative alpha-L-arabinofuranosidase A n=1 Tax=Colletotrichum siamense TaxID=690259 RepID=UPI0018722861|nr:putative alpha-L-arabinofuranosidase A [Colletotrichum siamense]KAF5498017.1 putative alpha-L-arabinofuranosidase A [Colletotrichum siamense]